MFTSTTGLEAPGLTSEQMESLERAGRLSFLKFEDHISYALFQSFGKASGDDGNNTDYSYNSENQGSFIRSYFYSLIIFHAGNPGVGNANVPDSNPFGNYSKSVQLAILDELWGGACLSYEAGENGVKDNNLFLQVYSVYSDEQYRLYKSDLGDGMDIILHYNAKGYEKYEWIQTVISSSLNNPGMPFNDYEKIYDEKIKSYRPSDNALVPFYFPRNLLDKQKSEIKDYNLRFEDHPNRYYKENNHYFRAELSLIGYKNGRWHHIETFRYGFEVRNNIVMPYQFQRGQKPYYNSYLINKLNK